MLKLVNRDKDIVGGAYRYKQIVEDYPITLDFSRDNNCKEEETGLVYVTRLPTGLMCLKREVFGKLVDHYDMKADERNIHQFFRTGMVFPGDPQWWGEDTYFCKRWIDMGGLLYVEPDINFTHIGTQEFKGNYHAHLMGKRTELLDKSDSGIPGWMSESEIETIKALVSRCDSVVEVGCWKGRTTKVLLDNCKLVIAVDHWLGSAGDLLEEMIHLEDVFAEFNKNVGNYSNLIIKKGHSLDVVKETEPVDMVFVDAGHTKEECRADLDAWLPKAKKIIAGHDYVETYPDVMNAVNEKFKDTKVNVVNSVWWVNLEG
jgi:precorrin-6B methylase 2